MVEADARKLGVRPVITSNQSLAALTLSQGYHFVSLFAIAALLATGMTAFLAVFWSIVIAVILSIIRADQRLITLLAAGIGTLVSGLAWLFLYQRLSVAAFLGLVAAGLVSVAQYGFERYRGPTANPVAERLAAALIEGGKGTVGIAATCATAGIIVSIINLTGLGLKMSSLIVDLGGGSLFFTIMLAAVAVWLLGTAIPVTASYIIAAVILVPALTSLGVPPAAAHMFMFYYAVLADVSPPTALAPFAASAICGGKPIATTVQAWKYTLPAFVAPVMWCLSPQGVGLLLEGSWAQIAWTTLIAIISLSGFAIGFSGWIAGPASSLERLAGALGGTGLMVPDYRWQLGGATVIAGGILLHLTRRSFAAKIIT
jgi:TRAP-type uncharacterized transport system fused permease subunit